MGSLFVVRIAGFWCEYQSVSDADTQSSRNGLGIIGEVNIISKSISFAYLELWVLYRPCGYFTRKARHLLYLAEKNAYALLEIFPSLEHPRLRMGGLMTEEERIGIAGWLEHEGYGVETDDHHVIAEKAGHRISILLGHSGHLDAVLDEVKDTSTILKLESKEARGVTLSWEMRDGRLLFIREDAVSRTIMSVS